MPRSGRIKRRCANDIPRVFAIGERNGFRMRRNSRAFVWSDNPIPVREWTRRFSHRSHSLNFAKVSSVAGDKTRKRKKKKKK